MIISALIVATGAMALMITSTLAAIREMNRQVSDLINPPRIDA